MRDLADVLTEATGRPARLVADATHLDDSFRLVADVGKLRGLGFEPAIDLLEGVRRLATELGPDAELPSVRPVFRRPEGDGRPSGGQGVGTGMGEVPAC